jgi:hypothetical protein
MNNKHVIYLPFLSAFIGNWGGFMLFPDGKMTEHDQAGRAAGASAAQTFMIKPPKSRSAELPDTAIS